MKNKGFYIVSGIISMLIMLAFLALTGLMVYIGVLLAISLEDTLKIPIIGIVLAMIPFACFIGAIVLLLLGMVQLSCGIAKFKIASNKFPKKKIKGLVALIVFDFLFLIIAIIALFSALGDDGSSTSDPQLSLAISVAMLVIFVIAVVFDIIGYNLVKKARVQALALETKVESETGKPAPVSKNFCKFCGAKLADGVKKCPKCGASI